MAAKTSARPNPLLARWRGPFGLPPFADIGPDDYRAAFKEAIAENRAAIDAIKANPAHASFANTVVAFEKAMLAFERPGNVFFNVVATDGDESLQAIERELAPRLAAHWSRISLDAKLFGRFDELFQRVEKLKLDDEQARTLERIHTSFVRAGARLPSRQKKRVAEINERLAVLATQFMQNVLKDEQSWRMVLDGPKDLAGLPPSLVAAAARAAGEAGLPGKHVITLARSSVEGFLTFSSRRDLREEAFKAWTRRGENPGATDNRGIVAEIVALRTELARIMGYDTYAAYALADQMAKTPEAVRDLLGQVWPKAVSRALEEREALAGLARAEGSDARVAAWDWRYLAEKERKARYDLDEAELRPYFQLDNMIRAAFACAERLFGLRFKEVEGLELYHPDVRAFEVSDRKGNHVGLFLGDYFARPSKRSGAWMSSFRTQHKLASGAAGDGIRPIIVNVMSFARGAEGEPTLLSYDDARTLFHEFGHALHGLLSDVTYPTISGTAVPRDFVELPSQLYEHWLSQPAVLAEFAVDARGRPLPKKLLQRLKAARNFNQGFTTVEYTACAILDMDLHSLESTDGLDISAFEAKQLDRIGMPAEIAMRHRLPHFSHIIGGYSAGYYSYMWSEVMDADAFAAFEEAGDIFHRPTAKRLRKFIYSAGNRRDPLEAYVAFRGRPPAIEGLLRKKGLV
mgnify:FL=1